MMMRWMLFFRRVDRDMGENMQTFYMIIGGEALFLYTKEGASYQRQYIAANPEFPYQPSRVRDDVQKLLSILVEEYNLEDRSELTFSVVGGEDIVITETVCSVLDGNISDQYSLHSVISKIITKLDKDEKLLIKEFGINFDGINYRLVSGSIQKSDYNLLGYTIQADDLMRYIG